jgi:hypothetical protein
MPEEKPVRPEFRYEDRPELIETFSDSIHSWSFDGQTLRIEFTVSRVDEAPKSGPRRGRKIPTCRLVLSVAGAVELINLSRQLTAALQKAGAVREQTEASSPTDKSS